jgi:hypothetical protein
MCYTLAMRFAMPLLLLLPTPALAADPIASVVCATRETMLRRLEVEYGASRQGWGLRGHGSVMEVWAVPSTGEWTLVQTYPDGQSCIVAMGESWEMEPPADPA